MNRQDRSASNDNTEGDDANIVSPVAVAGSSLESEVAAPAASLPSRTPTIRQLSFASPVAAVPEAFTSPSSTPVNTSASTIPPQAMHPALVSEVAKLLVGGYNENTSPPVATSTATGTHPINSNSEVVKLNVGGCKFTTSRSTLRRVPGTHFEAMFSGRHAFAASQDEEGQYFIDRDGNHFRHILNYLRAVAVVTLPETDRGKEELAIEADFYGLDGLVRAIRMPRVDVSEYLTEETLSQRENEYKLRKAFANRASEGFDPYRGLIPIFCPDNGLKSLPLKYDPTNEARNEASLFMGGLRKKQKSKCPPVTVATLDEFRTNFNREWPNVLHRIGDILVLEPIIIAGGSVLRALTASNGIRTGGYWWGQTSDIDMFIYCRDPEEAIRITRRIFYALAVDNERWVIVRGRGVMNIHKWVRRQGPEIKIQIVLRLYDSPTEVLVGFDLDCCTCAYDGRSVWLAPRCISSLQSGLNTFNPLHAWPNKPSYELRLAKYAFRGFAVLVPGIDKKRIDYDRIHRSKLGDLKGMARLMKVTSEMESSLPSSEWNQQQRRSQERPRTPREVATLREEETKALSDDEHLVGGIDLGYDDDVTNVIVPRVYVRASDWAEDRPSEIMWNNYGSFPHSNDSRDEAWADIVDAGEEHFAACVPRRLIEAWDTEKRSREYLNDNTDKYDLDSLYYSSAYKDKDNA